MRLFVAIDPPEACCVALSALARRIRGVTWSPPHHYHLTLRFLGEAPATRLEALQAALRHVNVATFVLPIEGVGSFPPRRPAAVLWAGVGTGHPRLFQLRQQVDDALLTCGPELDVRSFHPHFTLARCSREAPPGEIARFLREHAAFEAPLFKVDAFTLYQSTLGPQGATHQPIERFGLRAT